MAFVTQGISSSKSGKEAGSTPSAGFTHPHKSVLEPSFMRPLVIYRIVEVGDNTPFKERVKSELVESINLDHRCLS